MTRMAGLPKSLGLFAWTKVSRVGLGHCYPGQKVTIGVKGTISDRNGRPQAARNRSITLGRGVTDGKL